MRLDRKKKHLRGKNEVKQKKGSKYLPFNKLKLNSNPAFFPLRCLISEQRLSAAERHIRRSPRGTIGSRLPQAA